MVVIWIGLAMGQNSSAPTHHLLCSQVMEATGLGAAVFLLATLSIGIVNVLFTSWRSCS